MRYSSFALRNVIMVDEPRYRPLAWAVSLPFIVAAVWVALVLLAQHHRGVLVAELSDIAAHGNTAEAAFAVRQLSAMPNPPVDLLVAAATSPTRGVAVEAQLAINNLVRHWYRDVKSGNRQQHVANQLMALGRRVIPPASGVLHRRLPVARPDHAGAFSAWPTTSRRR